MEYYEKFFSPIHKHSNFSIRDGISSVKDIVKKHKELNYPSVNLTEHGTIGNQYQLFTECEKNDLKPILGIEFYMVLDNHKDVKRKDNINTTGLPYNDDKTYHITVYVKNEIGYKNLLKLIYLIL